MPAEELVTENAATGPTPATGAAQSTADDLSRESGDATAQARPRHPGRRRWIVDDLQYRLLITNLSYFVVGMLIVGAVVFVPLIVEVRDISVPAVQRSVAASELLALHRRFWPGLLLALLLLAAHSVLTSHRISGPLYRIRQVLRTAAAGDLSGSVKLRKHDFMNDEAETINALLDAQRSRFAALAAHQGTLAACADEIEEGADPNDADLRERVGRLRRELDAARRTLAEVKLEHEKD